MTANMTITRCNGSLARVDMTKFLQLGDGVSQIHPGWESSLVFSPELSCFVELSNGPPDIRGNCDGDAVEVDDAYVKRVYGKTRSDV